MPRSIVLKKRFFAPSFRELIQPLSRILPRTPRLESRGNRPLQMTFEDQLNALIFFHLEEHTSARHLVQVLQDDEFARNNIAPEGGISRSSFSEAVNERGLEQFMYVFGQLQKQAGSILPKRYSDLGDLVSIDGSLIDAVLSMSWADYRNGSKKARFHLGFNINRGVPQKLFLTDGKGDERPFVHQILEPGQTGIMDRGYQHHKNFDELQEEQKHFVCRIKENTIKTCMEQYNTVSGGKVFYDAKVLLGRPGAKQTQRPVRLVGYKADDVTYRVATDRFDLTAEDITRIYKLRREVEKFFAWWKRHLRVYHLIARSKHGLTVQILSGLITYLLLAIYCHEHHGEHVTIKRVGELRIKIQNELRDIENAAPDPGAPSCEHTEILYANP